MSLPTIIYVHEGKNQDGTTDLYAWKTAAEAIEDDGPTVVGTYKLVGKRTMRKVVQESKA
jgi:hypothetical protein